MSLLRSGGVWPSSVGASDLSSRVAAFVGGTGLLIWPYLEPIDLFTLVSYCRQPSLWILGSGFEQHLLNHLGTFSSHRIGDCPLWCGAIRAWTTSVTMGAMGAILIPSARPWVSGERIV